MKTLRESTIEAVKAMGITPRELGFEPEVEYETDYKIVKAFKDVIENFNLNKDDIRKYIPKEYWDDLDIKEKTYKVINVTYTKTITKTVPVVLLNDMSSYDVTDYVSERDIEDSDDETEDDWEYEDYEVEDTDMSKADVLEYYEPVNDIDDLDY